MMITYHELKTYLADNITSTISTIGRELPEIEGLDKPTEAMLRTAWREAFDAISTIVRITAAPFYKLDLS